MNEIATANGVQIPGLIAFEIREKKNTDTIGIDVDVTGTIVWRLYHLEPIVQNVLTCGSHVELAYYPIGNVPGHPVWRVAAYLLSTETIVSQQRSVCNVEWAAVGELHKELCSE